MQFHTEGNFTGMFKGIKKSFKNTEILIFFLTTPFFLPANQLIF